MNGDWKPGDVARVRYSTVDEVALVRPRTAAAGRLEFAYGTGSYDMVGTVNASRLVVIDPEDAKQVKRLTALLGWALHPTDADRLAAALREFAAPTPPKCSAHGAVACCLCSRITGEHLRDNGTCDSCETWGETGMHWDTCPGRLRGKVYDNREAAVAEVTA